MRYAGLIKNDLAAGPGICVTFFTQGCPHRCHGCHNPETWAYDGGQEFYPDLIKEIADALTANGIERNFCIMGGEPLCPENEFLTMLLIIEVRNRVPDVPIYIWTGYTLEELMTKSDRVKTILKSINFLIDGPYKEELRDTTLHMRGSSNQRIIDMQTVDFS
jgi:anaerobic ribonucleoside-triphosphate reductase activating protein